MRASWRHVERSPDGLLGSLHDARTLKLAHWTNFSKNHSRPNALASTLFLLFGTRCRSDARGHGLAVFSAYGQFFPEIRPHG